MPITITLSDEIIDSISYHLAHHSLIDDDLYATLYDINNLTVNAIAALSSAPVEGSGARALESDCECGDLQAPGDICHHFLTVDGPCHDYNDVNESCPGDPSPFVG